METTKERAMDPEDMNANYTRRNAEELNLAPLHHFPSPLPVFLRSTLKETACRHDFPSG